MIAIFIGNAIKKKQIDIFESEGTKKDYIYINKVSEIISRIITEPQKNFFEVKEVKSGKVFLY